MEITIKQFQEEIKKIDHNPELKEKYFNKLIEEVGELSKAIRKNNIMKDNIKETIDEEIYDVIYYSLALANIYDIDVTKTAILKEKINSEKYNRKSMFE